MKFTELELLYRLIWFLIPCGVFVNHLTIPWHEEIFMLVMRWKEIYFLRTLRNSHYLKMTEFVDFQSSQRQCKTHQLIKSINLNLMWTQNNCLWDLLKIKPTLKGESINFQNEMLLNMNRNIVHFILLRVR